jgi:hypothetical protein
MRPPLDDARRAILLEAFWMPSVQTMVSRKSSITNAFVNAVIPTVAPSAEEIDEALTILGLDPLALHCAYCGGPASEWDHLRPLVVNRRPTGYISEIANLVPSCGKCNQSKGNKNWLTWMLSKAKLSPTGRNVADVDERIARLEAYEKWRTPTNLDFEKIIGSDEWRKYWQHWDAVMCQLVECQQVADALKARIGQVLPKLS